MKGPEFADSFAATIEDTGKVYTHAGGFHADDVFSTALINKFCDGRSIERPEVVRIPDFRLTDEIKNNNILYDVGRGDFDHHQADNEAHDTGEPYAAFGKLFEVIGREVFGDKAETMKEYFVKVIDECDNTKKDNPTSAAIREMNPLYGETFSTDEGFASAVEKAEGMLDDRAERLDSIDAGASREEAKEYMTTLSEPEAADKAVRDGERDVAVSGMKDEISAAMGKMSTVKEDYKVMHFDKPGIPYTMIREASDNSPDKIIGYTFPARGSVSFKPLMDGIIPSSWQGADKETLENNVPGMNFVANGGITAAFDDMGSLLKGCEAITDHIDMKNDALQRIDTGAFPLANESPDIMRDKGVIMAAVTHDGYLLKYAPDDLKNDKEVVLAAVSNYGPALTYAPDDFKGDKDVVMAAISDEKHEYMITDYFGSISDELKNDKEVVMAAVSREPYAIEHASDELKNDKEVVMTAVTGRGYTLEFASDELKDDKEVVMAAVTETGYSLEYASDRLADDKEVVLTAVSNDGEALANASVGMRSDREVVMTAVAENGNALEYASKDLKNDKEVVLTAVSNDGSAIYYASDEMKNDKDVVITAVSNESDALSYVPDNFSDDKDVRIAAFSDSPENDIDSFIDEKSSMLDAISNDSCYEIDYVYDDDIGEKVEVYIHKLAFASDDIRNDKDVVMAAVSKDGSALEFASDDLKNDKEVVMAAVSNDGRALRYASEDLQNDKEVVMAALSNDGRALEYASDDFKNDKEVVMTAVSECGMALEYASDDFKKDVVYELSHEEWNVDEAAGADEENMEVGYDEGDVDCSDSVD